MAAATSTASETMTKIPSRARSLALRCFGAAPVTTRFARPQSPQRGAGEADGAVDGLGFRGGLPPAHARPR